MLLAFRIAIGIMPNHLHMLLHYTGDGFSVNTLIGNGKRFAAYEIIKKT